MEAEFGAEDAAEIGGANAEEAIADEEDLADEVAAADDLVATDAEAAEESPEVADVERALHGSLCIGCRVLDALVKFWANWENDS